MDSDFASAVIPANDIFDAHGISSDFRREPPRKSVLCRCERQAALPSICRTFEAGRRSTGLRDLAHQFDLEQADRRSKPMVDRQRRAKS
jgi:hypothetical protein